MNLSPDHMKDVSHKYGSKMHLQNSNLSTGHMKKFLTSIVSSMHLQTLCNDKMKISSTVWFFYVSPNQGAKMYVSMSAVLKGNFLYDINLAGIFWALYAL